LDSSNRLGEYLRARRKLLSPDDVDLVRPGRRRIAGLRREEVALLAGISPDYYARVEQGRQHPSPRVLSALANALLLDDDARRYLHQLEEPSVRPVGTPTTDSLSTGLAHLVEFVDIPAFVLSRFRRILVLNRLAEILLPILKTGSNQLTAIFLDPEAKRLYANWSTITGIAVRGLRSAAGRDLDDPELSALVEELSAGSDRFRELWARHEATVVPSDIAEFDHPLLGRFNLRFEALELLGTEGQLLVIFYPDQDGASFAAMRRLRELAEQDGS